MNFASSALSVHILRVLYVWTPGSKPAAVARGASVERLLDAEEKRPDVEVA